MEFQLLQWELEKKGVIALLRLFHLLECFALRKQSRYTFV